MNYCGVKIKYFFVLLLMLAVKASYACNIVEVREPTMYAQTSRYMDALGKSDETSCHKILIKYLASADQSIRIRAALILAEIKVLPDMALPALIKNFSEPNGEEGAEYAGAVVAYGIVAEPYLEKAINHSSWYVRERACDSLMEIKNIKDYRWRNRCNPSGSSK